MGTKIDHKQPQVLLRGAGLSRGEYNNIIPLFFFLKSYPISYNFTYIAPLNLNSHMFSREKSSCKWILMPVFTLELGARIRLFNAILHVN